MRRVVSILFWSVAWSAVACSSATPASDGQCDVNLMLQCGDGYTGYHCSGSARPDDDPQYIEGVPHGVVCAAKSEQEYCCTARTTSCAYNPVALCDPDWTGFQCRGANRPDALHAALSCGNGVREGDLVNYCCSADPPDPGCLQSDAVTCSSRLMGFSCRGDSLPR